MALLREGHPTDLAVMQAVVQEAQTMQDERDEQLAARIAQAVGKLFPQGK